MSRALDPNPGGARDMEREEITLCPDLWKLA